MKRCSGSRSRRNCAKNDSPVPRARRSCCHLVSMTDHVKAEPRHNTTTITLPGRSAYPKIYKMPPAARTTFIPNPPCAPKVFRAISTYTVLHRPVKPFFGFLRKTVTFRRRWRFVALTHLFRLEFSPHLRYTQHGLQRN